MKTGSRMVSTDSRNMRFLNSSLLVRYSRPACHGPEKCKRPPRRAIQRQSRHFPEHNAQNFCMKAGECETDGLQGQLAGGSLGTLALRKSDSTSATYLLSSSSVCSSTIGIPSIRLVCGCAAQGPTRQHGRRRMPQAA